MSSLVAFASTTIKRRSQIIKRAPATTESFGPLATAGLTTGPADGGTAEPSPGDRAAPPSDKTRG